MTISPPDRRMEPLVLANSAPEQPVEQQQAEEAQTNKQEAACRNSRTIIMERRQSTFESVTDDVINDLSLESEFYARNRLRPIPSFAKADIQVGILLGEGQFGSVYEVVSFGSASEMGDSSTLEVVDSDDSLEEHQDNSHRSSSSTLHTGSPSRPRSISLTGDSESFYFDDEVDETEQRHLVRTAKAKMIRHPLHSNGQARFAVKLLRPDVRATIRSDAILDMACEAEFLSRISHPNIVRLRGTVGNLGYSSFMLVLERLEQTLSDKLEEWKVLVKRQKRPFSKFRSGKGMFLRKRKAVQQPPPFHHQRHESLQQTLYRERLRAAVHVARALGHLHRRGLLFRDVKPDNVGLDHEGQWRLFDFGLSKELKEKDLVQPPDGYNTTGTVGSRRYMAPEVVRNLPYGFSADVFSFGILFWELFALELPFCHLDASKHYEQVVVQHRRPSAIRHVLPPILHDLMEACWSDHPLERPRLTEICQALDQQVLELNEVCDKEQSQQTASGKDSGQGATSVRSTNTWPLTNLRSSFRRTASTNGGGSPKEQQAPRRPSNCWRRTGGRTLTE